MAVTATSRFAVLILIFFLFAVFLFTQRALEPTLSFSLYRDLISQTPSSSSSSSFSSAPAILPISAAISPEPQPSTDYTEAGIEILGEELAEPSDENPVGGNEGADSGYEIRGLENCDLYSGTWVKDGDQRYPLYGARSCPYVDEAFDCQANGRPDSEYLHWRWKPHGCDLPNQSCSSFYKNGMLITIQKESPVLLRIRRFRFLETLRGKKMMLVGDSVNRNQYESILCLLREGLSYKSTMYEAYGHKITKGRGYYVFKFESHFLVREGVRLNGDGNSNPTLSIDRIDNSASRWKRADILVFNTGHWWTHGKTARGLLAIGKIITKRETLFTRNSMRSKPIEGL